MGRWIQNRKVGVMMKKKNIVFTVITLLFVGILATATVKFVKSNVDVNPIEQPVKTQQVYDLIDLYSQTILYDATRYGSDIQHPNENKKYYNYIDAYVVSDFQHYLENLMSDPNIQFQMRINDEMVRSNKANIDFKNTSWFGTLSYNEKGECTSKTSDHANLCQFINFNYHEPSYDEDGNWQPELISENPPNVSFTFALPKNPIESGDFYAALTNNYFPNEEASAFTMMAIMVSGIVLLLYMLFMPYSLVSNVNPFKTIKDYKLLIHMIVLGFVLVMMLEGAVHEVSGIMVTQLKNTAPLPNFITNEMIELGYIVYYMVFYSFILWAGFVVKTILKKGIFTYLKENTFIGSIIRSMRSLMNTYATFDLGLDYNKNVFKFMVLNAVILLLISLIPGINIILIILYICLFYQFTKKKLFQLKTDYDKLLRKTQLVSQGDFSKNESSNYGYFQTLGDAFENIQEGFEKAVNEEVKSTRVKTELISNVSHDLKTPLTSIITYVDLLKKEDINEEERENYLDILDRNSLRLKHLIEDLFEVSKVNSGDVKLDLVEVDLVSLMNQTLFENEDQLAQKNLDVRFTANQDKMMLTCDSLKTYRIFENLLNNISKYALANTRVYITLEESEHEIKAMFKNISEEEMDFDSDEIMERFVRGDQSRNSEGSGLGLAIVKSFAEIQNATFNIETDGDLFKSIITFKKN